jgi:hypothetical protein
MNFYLDSFNLLEQQFIELPLFFVLKEKRLIQFSKFQTESLQLVKELVECKGLDHYDAMLHIARLNLPYPFVLCINKENQVYDNHECICDNLLGKHKWKNCIYHIIYKCELDLFHFAIKNGLDEFFVSLITRFFYNSGKDYDPYYTIITILKWCIKYSKNIMFKTTVCCLLKITQNIDTDKPCSDNLYRTYRPGGELFSYIGDINYYINIDENLYDYLEEMECMFIRKIFTLEYDFIEHCTIIWNTLNESYNNMVDKLRKILLEELPYSINEDIIYNVIVPPKRNYKKLEEYLESNHILV